MRLFTRLRWTPGVGRGHPAGKVFSWRGFNILNYLAGRQPPPMISDSSVRHVGCYLLLLYFVGMLRPEDASPVVFMPHLSCWTNERSHN